MGYESAIKKLRYRDFRTCVRDIPVGKWFVYHRGKLDVAAVGSTDIAMVRRLVTGLRLGGHAILMQKRNKEGVIEYLMYPIHKIGDEEFEEALALTTGR